MEVLKVEGLVKRYPRFTLDGVSFSMREGEIMGFIGRNGAGKSTTLKCMLGLVHKDAGEISFFARPSEGDNRESLQSIGFANGGAQFYPRCRLRDITAATRRFYSRWDDAAYRAYMTQFELAEDKTPAQLSAGMQVKYALTLALSHHARLLILDEPTSGLDPVSREEILDIFLRLQREGVSILFSTHLTADLEKCADSVTYIRRGRVMQSAGMEEMIAQYRLFCAQEVPQALRPYLIGLKTDKRGYAALIRTQDAQRQNAYGEAFRAPSLDEIMIHFEGEEESDAGNAL